MEEKLEKTLKGDSWLGHPVHPALVAFPIGMWCLGATMDFIAAFSKNKCIQETADHAVTAGLVGAGLSAAAGLAEYSRVSQDESTREIALTHAVTNVSAMAVNSVNAIVRSGRRGAGRPGGFLPKLLSLSAIGLISYSGWLGGNMVFNHGAGVDTKRKDIECRNELQGTEEKLKSRAEARKRKHEEEVRTHA